MSAPSLSVLQDGTMFNFSNCKQVRKTVGQFNLCTPLIKPQSILTIINFVSGADTKDIKLLNNASPEM